MISIALAVFSLAVLYVMIWSIRNDGAKSVSEQTGWIKMRNPFPVAKRFGKRVGKAQGIPAEKPAEDSTAPQGLRRNQPAPRGGPRRR